MLRSFCSSSVTAVTGEPRFRHNRTRCESARARRPSEKFFHYAILGCTNSRETYCFRNTKGCTSWIPYCLLASTTLEDHKWQQLGSTKCVIGGRHEPHQQALSQASVSTVKSFK